MRWIEILQLRANKAPELDALIEGFNRSLEKEDIEFAIYRRATIPTDISIHLIHKTDRDTGPDQTLGQRLGASLGDHGQVCHTLWIEMHPSDRR